MFECSVVRMRWSNLREGAGAISTMKSSSTLDGGKPMKGAA